jgi:hypothetical protein
VSWQKAEQLQSRAFVIYEKNLGHYDPEVAICLNNLANTYTLEGKLAEAKRASVQACEIATKSLGAGHPLTRRCIATLDVILGQESGVAKPVVSGPAPVDKKEPGQSEPSKENSVKDATIESIVKTTSSGKTGNAEANSNSH